MLLLYILPNQLFEYKFIPKETDAIVLWEHPSFFTKYKFNKKETSFTQSVYEILF